MGKEVRESLQVRHYHASEERYRMARKAPGIIYQWNFPGHILTKSLLVLLDATSTFFAASI